MTICIAAICRTDPEPGIVLCTDGKAGNILGSHEQVLKDRDMPGGWRCLTAGSDDDIYSLLPLFRREIGKLLPTIDETNIKPALEEAMRQRKTQKADGYTTAKWGMTFEQFRKARGDFPEADFRADMEAIGRDAINADCLLAGFLSDGVPLLLQAHGSFPVAIRENYAVAGTGAELAQSVLQHREYYDSSSLPGALYTVYEAKRYAERVATVGKATFMSVIRVGEMIKAVSDEGYRYLDAQFKRFGPQPININKVQFQPEHFFDLPGTGLR